MSLSAPAERRGSSTAVVISNVLEWYDFAIYIYLAGYIARRFFPAADEVTSILSTIGAFGVGFLARPIGAIVLGRLGDRDGRKPTLILAMFMMGGGSVLIGVLPTQSAIGAAAPVLLVLARLIQGFSLGGAWGLANSLVIEQAPARRRGLHGSLMQTSIVVGLTLASGMVAAFSTWLTPVEMSDWGWRFPFLIGGLLAPLAAYLARTAPESAAWERARRMPAPVAPSGLGLATRAFGLTLAWTASFYILLNHLPVWTQRHLKLDAVDALWANTMMLLVLACLTPLMGLLADRVGRRRVLIAACIALIGLPYPLFTILDSPSLSPGVLILCQLGMLLLIAMLSGASPATLAELFPTRIRATWMTPGYAFAVALFGGVVPYFLIFTLARGHLAEAYGIYLALAAALSGSVAWTLRETAFEELA